MRPAKLLLLAIAAAAALAYGFQLAMVCTFGSSHRVTLASPLPATAGVMPVVYLREVAPFSHCMVVEDVCIQQGAFVIHRPPDSSTRRRPPAIANALSSLRYTLFLSLWNELWNQSSFTMPGFHDGQLGSSFQPPVPAVRLNVTSDCGGKPKLDGDHTPLSWSPMFPTNYAETIMRSIVPLFSILLKRQDTKARTCARYWVPGELFLAEAGESCTTACASKGMACDLLAVSKWAGSSEQGGKGPTCDDDNKTGHLVGHQRVCACKQSETEAGMTKNSVCRQWQTVSSLHSSEIMLFANMGGVPLPDYFKDLLSPLSNVVQELSTVGSQERCGACYRRLEVCRLGQFGIIPTTEREGMTSLRRGLRMLALSVSHHHGASLGFQVKGKSDDLSRAEWLGRVGVVVREPGAGTLNGTMRQIMNLQGLVAAMTRAGLSPSFVRFEMLPLKSMVTLLGSLGTLVGIHGAGLLNGIFLRPEAALVEIRPFQFDVMEHFHWPKCIEEDFRVFGLIMYFSICIYDATLSRPGAIEGLQSDLIAASVDDESIEWQTGYTMFTPRDRNVVLPPQYLLAVIDVAVEIADLKEYYNTETKLCTSGWDMHMRDQNFTEGDRRAAGCSNSTRLAAKLRARERW